MDKKKSGSKLIVDVKIHYQGKVYNLALGRVLRWLLPLAIVAIRVISHLRDSSS